jgi:predicted permease
MLRPGVRRLLQLPLRGRDEVARDTNEEIAIHIAERAAQLEEQGWSPEAARAEALRRFGPVAEARGELVRAALRRQRHLGLRQHLDGWGQDLRGAWRATVAEPGLNAIVILVIALGVGANAATFGIYDRLQLLGPSHIVEPQQVFRAFASVDLGAMGQQATSSFGYATYTTLRDEVSAFSGVAASSSGGSDQRTLGTGAEASRVAAADATWDFFPTLGVRPTLGRFFTAEEDEPGAAQPVVVLGDALWRERFGSDPDVLGRQVLVDGTPLTVVGVAPPGFTGVQLGRVDVWLPMSLRGPRVAEDWQTSLSFQWLQVIARLAPGSSAEQAAAEATGALQALFAGSGEPLAEAAVSVRHLTAARNEEAAKEAMVLRWLVGVALVLLVVACANVGNLLLARAIRRRREIAMRLALGISGWRLLRLLLLQGALLSGLGGVAAIAIAAPAANALRRTLLPGVEWATPAVNGRVLAFALLLTLGTGIVTGLAPALLARRRYLVTALRAGVREGGGRSSRLRLALTVAQGALSVLLLIAAGLFARSLWRAQGADLGIEPARVLTAGARWPSTPMGGEEAWAQHARREREFFAAALERARRLPGIEAAAVAVGTPFRSSFTVPLRAAGWETLPELPGGGPYIQAVTGGYLETMGLRLLAGRDFAASDRAGSERVAMVSATMAGTLWPGEPALGRCLQVGDGESPPCTRVVGVVEDARRDGLVEPPAMQYYVPLGQEEGFGGARLMARPRQGDEAAAYRLRQSLAEVDPTVLWVDVETLATQLEPQLRPWRLGASVVGILGALALLVAALGLASLVSHLVANHTHEIGVRLALGARRSDVLALVLRRGLVVAGSGVALGTLLAAAVGPRLSGLLFATSPHDPLVYGAVGLALLAAAVTACLPSARRALGIEPTSALREE